MSDGTATTKRFRRQNFDAPDETRTFEKGKAQLVKSEGVTIGRFIFEPGWKWSQHVKPIAKTDSCQATHAGYVVSGRLAVRLNDGSQHEFGPGDAHIVPPGHDAWVVGPEKVVLLDFQGAADYAKGN